MRQSFWVFASFGILGVALALADVVADDSDPFGDRAGNDPAAAHSTDANIAPERAKLAGARPRSTASLTDPISTAPKEHSDDAFGDHGARPEADRSFSVINADFQKPKSVDTEHAAKKSELIHAEYRRGFGESERGQIHQVHATASKFDHPAAAEAAVDASLAPAVAVRWVKKSPLSVGQECACDLVATNSGQSPARNLTIDAFFPPTIRLTHAEPMPADNQDHVTWQLPTLGPGEERVIHITFIPSQRGELATRALVRFSETASGVFLVEEPLIRLELHGPKQLLVGDPATQEITITNPGTGTAHNVKIEAHLSKGLEHPRGDHLVIKVGSLSPGESRLVRLPLVALAGGEQSIAIVAAGDSELHRELNTKINVVAPSLKVALDGPSLRYVGRKANYVVTVINDGGAPSNNVRVTHKLPAGFQFVSADKGGEFDESARTVNWYLGRIDSKQSVHLRLQLLTTEIGTHPHSVAVVSDQGAKAEARLETVVDGTASLQVEVLNQNNPVEVGVETAYEIHVRNDGSKAAENVAISCQAPAAVQVLHTEGATDGHAEKGVLTFAPISQLEPGKTAIYRVYVRGRSEGNHRFKVRLSSDSIKEPLTYEEMTKFYAE